MSIQCLGDNLRRFMKMNSLSIVKLANQTGLGSATISNILNSKSTPTSATLITLADVLNVKVNDLLEETHELKTLRFRTKSSLSAPEIAKREQLKISTSRWIRDYLELETTLNEKRENKLENCTLSDPQSAATEVRKLLNYDEKEPISDLCSHLEDAGVKVLMYPFGFRKTFGLSVGKDDGGPAIVVNSDSDITEERKYFTLAHELGHLVLHKTSYDGQVKDEDKIEEKQANEFASFFLMPEEAFKNKWKTYKGMLWVDAVLDIRTFFGVSYKTVLYRLDCLYGNRLPKGYFYSEFKRIYEDNHKCKLKYDIEPDKSLSPADKEVFGSMQILINPRRFESLIRSAIDDGKISISRASEMLNISLVDMRNRMMGWI